MEQSVGLPVRPGVRRAVAPEPGRAANVDIDRAQLRGQAIEHSCEWERGGHDACGCEYRETEVTVPLSWLVSLPLPLPTSHPSPATFHPHPGSASDAARAIRPARRCRRQQRPRPCTRAPLLAPRTQLRPRKPHRPGRGADLSPHQQAGVALGRVHPGRARGRVMCRITARSPRVLRLGALGPRGSGRRSFFEHRAPGCRCFWHRRHRRRSERRGGRGGHRRGGRVPGLVPSGRAALGLFVVVSQRLRCSCRCFLSRGAVPGAAVALLA